MRHVTSKLAALAAFAISSAALAQVPPRASDPVPDPGKGVATADDDAAIAVNPANLAFLPEPELRWNWVQTGSASPLPARGHSFALGVPIWKLATGLRFDFLSPTEASPLPFDTNYHWARWDVAARVGNAVALGTTFGWGGSSKPALDGLFSVTSSITLRPSQQLSLAIIARDWNEPESKSHTTIDRSWVFGAGFRPVGTRGFEIDAEAAFSPKYSDWTPRFVAGLDVPRLGRLRGEVRVDDPSHTPKLLATAGLDINMGLLQLSGGGVFGSAVTKSGTGFYAGAAIRGFREPGVSLPTRVAKITIEDTPGNRGHVRLLRRLWRLANDPEVEGVALVLHAEPAGSFAHAEELGDAIRMLRANGKKVLCHVEDARGRTLYVCAQANRIAMNPAGGLRFSGLSSQYFYLGGLLKKLGAKADFVRIGAHKGAAEQFTNEHGSDVAESDHEEMIRELEKTYLNDVGGALGMSVAELKKRLAKGPFIASEARDQGFVQVLAYEDELDRAVAEMMNHPVRVMDDEPSARAPRRWGDVPKVAVIYLDGTMIDGESQAIPFIGFRTAGSRTLQKAIKRAKEDPTVKAILFRIESGGGSSLAADVMLREAQLAAKEKPFVVSMGSTAASGGYYAAMAGKPVFASRTTITGSIGIFYGKVDVSGLLDKLGVHVDVARSAPRADAESFFRPFTDDERAELGNKVKQFYDTFIARVSEGRGMKPEAIDAIARGKVWTGEQALARGLVDKQGGLREALEEARRLANLPDDAPIVELPEEDDSLLGLLLQLAGVSAAGLAPNVSLAAVAPSLVGVARAFAPFLVFEPEKPLAIAELGEDEPAAMSGLKALAPAKSNDP